MKLVVKNLLFFILLVFNNISFSKQNIIKNIRTSDKPDNITTRIVLDLSQKTPYSLFTLDNNPRLVIDLEASENKEIYDLKSKIISKIRINNNGKGVIRLVFDLKYKAFIEKNFYLNKDEKGLYRLVIDLKREKKVISKKVKVKSKKPFTITLDPGHGGLDPGAIRYNYREKDITLLAAKELKTILDKKGFKVYLTRNKDEFISLRKRRNIAKKNNSDLFISIHVDSVKKNQREELLFIRFQIKLLIKLPPC